MLKRTGIVVLGAAAGVMSLSSVAWAGDDGGADTQSTHHESHHEGHYGHGSCDKIAASGGGNLVDLSNLASNLDVSHLNVLAADNSVDGGGSCHGDKAAVSGGGNLIDGSNILSNADLHHVNVLASDNSLTG